MKTLLVRFALLSALLISLTVFFTTRHAETRSLEGEAYAIKGGIVVTVTGATIPNGVVVIRDGLIQAVGADVAIPGDARIIEASGMMVYPGLIDAYTTYGLRPPAQPGTGQGGGENPTQAMIAAMTAPPSTVGLLPEVSVTEQLQISAETFDQQRAAGITTALTGLRDGVFRGQSAIINLGGDAAEKLVLKAPASLNIAFGSSRGGYPNSLMGVFSFLRQSFMDAQYYRDEWARYNKSQRGVTRPQINKSLASMQPFINAELPVIFNASSVREMRRAIGLAEEFNLKYLLAGGAQSYQMADYLKQKNAAVLLSLSYPQKPQGLDDPEDEPLRIIRDRQDAPKAAAALHKAGVKFAFQSGGLARPQDYVANASRAIEAGLPKDEALKALTIYPAQIFGLSEQLGSLEKGKIANVIIASGDLFSKDSKVRHVFVDGRYFAIKVAETPRPAAGAVAAAGSNANGTWTLNINSPQGEIVSTLTLRQEGSALSGEIKSQLGTSPITGSIKGNEITFDYKVNFQGQDLPITATGKIDGASVSGQMSAMGTSFDYSGTKKPNP
jgi:imidazolonepropionase-like amidohydrolase